MNENLIDPTWRLNNLYKIKTKDSRIITFSENRVQQALNSSVSKSNRYIILKARQFGVSTNEILKIFDKTIWNRNVNSCILAHERDALEELFTIVRLAYEKLPDPKPALAKGGGSKYELVFEDIKSKIYVDLEVRGGTNHNLHVSELAFFKDRTRLDATLETVPLDGHISIETTPNGNNFFYDMWNDPDLKYKKLFFPWYCHDEYKVDTIIKKSQYTQDEHTLIKKALKHDIKITKEQIAFRRIKQNQLKELFVQEYPEDDNTCFISSGNPFFDNAIVKERLNKLEAPVQNKGTYVQFNEPIPNRRYVAGVDTAEGVGGDFSVMTLYDIKTQKQILTLRGQWRPSIFAERMYAVLDQYRGPNRVLPLLAIERNNHGHAVILAMQNLKYSNLFCDKDGREGFVTNRVSKPIMLNALKDFLQTTPDNINCKLFLQECLTFVNENGKINAIKGKHDDCIIANAIAIQMLIKELSIPDLSGVIDNFYGVEGGTREII